jgi:O-acetyl-ADP-ribose deacetylase (regulator of RNase III)
MQSHAVGRGRIELVCGDITQADTDGIANAANAMLLAGGGVDGAIHRAAGPGLQQALRKIKLEIDGGMLPTGQAVVTPGFGLKAKFVIHCVGPIYPREGQRAPELLARCYQSALALAQEHGIRTLAFPSISTGAYGYPVTEAAATALATLKDWLVSHAAPELCRFYLFDTPTLEAYQAAALRLA